MRSNVLKFIEKHKLLKEGQTIFVAVSGGPDSMALLHFLWDHRETLKITVKAIHVHHHLRGDEADQDATYIERYCLNYHIPFMKKDVDVRGHAKQRNIGTQLAARELRYQWFEELVDENSRIATGHHGDDQVETMIMMSVRGRNPLKAVGIPAFRELGHGAIIRPFLGITKQEIEHYCNDVSIVPRRDSSNSSRSYTRNRFREDLLPFLKGENPNVHLHMQRQQEWCSEDQQLLMELAEEILPTLVLSKNEQNVTISQRAFVKINMPLQRRVIHLILNYLYGKNSPSTNFIHIEQVHHMMNREHMNGEHYLPNSFLFRRDYDRCQFLKVEHSTLVQTSGELTIPGSTAIGDWFIQAHVTEEQDLNEADNQIILDLDQVQLPLTIRQVLPHDRMLCRGMSGSKKIRRLFIDRKVAHNERNDWPLVVDKMENILWVPLLHRSKVANVNRNTLKRLVLTCRRQVVDVED